MKISSIIFALLIFTTSWNTLKAQIARPIDFGQCLDSLISTEAATVTYITPFLSPGDVALIRLKEQGVKLKFELFTPSGLLVGSQVGKSTADLLQMIYKLPTTAESGQYKIIVSSVGGKGIFNIYLTKMNQPPGSTFLECNATLTGKLGCGPIVQAFRYAVQSNARSRIKITPIGTALEAWLCDPSGNVLQYQAVSLGVEIVFDNVLASKTTCYYILVASSNAFFASDFSLSHTILSGNCAIPTLNSNVINQSVCEGESVSFSLSQIDQIGLSYHWEGPNGFVSDQPQISFKAEKAHEGTYILTIKNTGDLCDYVYKRSLIVNLPPSVDATTIPTNSQVCEGKNLTLNVVSNPTPTGGESYRWNGPLSYTSTLQSPILLAVSPNHSGWYKVTVTDRKGCRNSDSVQVKVFVLPTASITLGPACMDQPLNLRAETTAAAEAAFAWTGPNGFISSSATPVIPRANSNSSGVYALTVTNNTTGCTSTVSRFITIHFPPTVSLSTDLSICQGESVKLTASGSTTYKWSNGSTTGSIEVTPLQTTVYSVTVTDTQNGCTNTKSVSVTVKPLPTVSINSTPANAEICEAPNKSVLLCGLVTAQSPSFQWSGPASFARTQCINLDKVTASGLYTLHVKDANTQCTQTAQIMVKIHATPKADIQIIPTGTICAGSTISLCANTNGSSPMLSWEGPGESQFTGQCWSLTNIKELQSGNYVLRVVDIFNCQASAELVVAVRPRPIADIVGNTLICKGATTTLSASGGNHYEWNTGQTNANLVVNPPADTRYTVVVQNNFGCKDTTSRIVQVQANNLSLSAKIESNTIRANAQGGRPPYQYIITPPLLPPNTTGIFENMPLGVYTITAIDMAGCPALTPVKIEIVPVQEDIEGVGKIHILPNPFSTALLIHAENIPDERIEWRLFDRHGRLIQQGILQEKEIPINTIELASGLYVLTISNQIHINRYKLLKL